MRAFFSKNVLQYYNNMYYNNIQSQSFSIGKEP